MHPPTRALAPLIAAALALAGCGSMDDAAAPTTPAAAAPAAASTVDDAAAASAATDAMADSATAAATTAMADAMPETTTGEAGDVATDAADAATSAAAPAVRLAAWQERPLVDVAGERFTLGDYVGRPLLVETFATWCHACAEQLPVTQAAARALGADAAVVAISVETDLDPDVVAAYAHERGLDDLRVVVASPQLLADLVDAFGAGVANPPGTPKILVGADGRPGDLRTGPEAADDLVAALRGAA